MKIENIDIISPELFPQETFNETEVFGALVWLWAVSPVYRHAGVQEAAVNILPVLKNGQFALDTPSPTVLGLISMKKLNGNISNPMMFCATRKTSAVETECGLSTGSHLSATAV